MENQKRIVLGSIAYILATGAISLAVVKFTTTIDALLQALAFSTVLIIFTTRVILPKIRTYSPRLTYFVEFIPLSLFVYLLVFSTGGISSPFLVLTHLFAIAMAFLITPTVSVFYVILTLFFVAYFTFSDISSLDFVKESPGVGFLYFLAYMAILPFSQYIAKIYQQQGQWAQKLSQMLTTSKKQEANLLRNITDAAFVVSPDFIISFSNDAASEKLSFSRRELLGKKIENVFKFKDNLGNNLSFDKLPFASAAKTKSESSVAEIQVSKKGGGWWRVNLKISPIIDHEGEVIGLLLIIKDFSQKDLSLGSYYDKIAQKFAADSQAKIAAVARDLLLLLSLETGIEGLSQFLNFSQIVENEAYNLQKTNFRKDVSVGFGKNTQDTLGPRGKIISPQKHALVQTAFILGSQNLLKVAVTYVLKTALSLSEKGSTLTLDISPSADVVRLDVLSNSKLPQEKVDLLFQKFFNQFLNLAELADFTGLEIAIAREIFEKHGGDLKIQQTEEGLLFSASLIRHEAASQPKTES